jgi:hypothetical protein
MKEYLVEFDVKLWDYVLHYQGEVIPLNKKNVRDAEWYAMLIVDGRKRNHDRSTGHSTTAPN